VSLLQTEGVQVIRVQVPLGEDPPYAIDENKIYVRDDDETSLAVRDEIVQLVLRGRSMKGVGEAVSAAIAQTSETHSQGHRTGSDHGNLEGGRSSGGSTIEAPRTGVEIVTSEKRNDTLYHHLRDLRNGNIVRNVTRQSARKLWHYAITQKEDDKNNIGDAQWSNGITVLSAYKRAGKMRYDLAQRENGKVRVYYGVTEDGVQDSSHTAWRELMELGDED
jgi:hypothetical protein